jgi:DDE family transposase
LGIEPMTRAKRKGQRDHYARKKDAARESLRWHRCAEAASQRLAGVESIHVMDREADIYELLSALLRDGRRFIIRSAQERSVDVGLLSSTVASAAMRFSREVQLSARAPAPGPQSGRSHPARRSRLALLAVSTTQVTIRKPKAAYDPGLPDSITINVVRVWEPQPPAGQEPVEWRLFTSEPIESQEQVEQIVDGYRARWVIEEYFKALKTGCRFERSQLESLSSLQNLLAIQAAVAWQLLALRSAARDQPQRPATDALSHAQIAALRLIVPGKPLSAEPTIADVTNAIAELGGHIKSNGPPGWQVLGRGFEELRRAEYLYTRMISATSSDQS